MTKHRYSVESALVSESASEDVMEQYYEMEDIVEAAEAWAKCGDAIFTVPEAFTLHELIMARFEAKP